MYVIFNKSVHVRAHDRVLKRLDIYKMLTSYDTLNITPFGKIKENMQQ